MAARPCETMPRLMESLAILQPALTFTGEPASRAATMMAVRSAALPKADAALGIVRGVRSEGFLDVLPPPAYVRAFPAVNRRFSSITKNHPVAQRGPHRTRDRQTYGQHAASP